MACACGEGGSRTPRNRDRIMLRGMLFHGYHGVLAEENKLGQKFLVDVDAWMDLSKAGESDEMGDSVSYADIYKQIKAIVEGPPFKLVESVANAIAKALLSAHPSISDVRVKFRSLYSDGGFQCVDRRSGHLLCWLAARRDSDFKYLWKDSSSVRGLSPNSFSSILLLDRVDLERERYLSGSASPARDWGLAGT